MIDPTDGSANAAACPGCGEIPRKRPSESDIRPAAIEPADPVTRFSRSIDWAAEIRRDRALGDFILAAVEALRRSGLVAETQSPDTSSAASPEPRTETAHEARPKAEQVAQSPATETIQQAPEEPLGSDARETAEPSGSHPAPEANLNNAIARIMPDWSPAVAAELADFGRRCGFNNAELAAMNDPRHFWMLRMAQIGANARGLKPKPTYVRDTHKGPGRDKNYDREGGASELETTETWIAARQAEVAKRADAPWRDAPYARRRNALN